MTFPKITPEEKNRHLTSWLYNVKDEFKPLSVDEIKAKLKETALPFAVLMTQILGDFAFGTVVRSANAFGAKEVFYYGPKKHWDRRSAVGTMAYTDVNYLKTIDEIKELKNRYSFVALENNIESKDIKEFIWPQNALIIMGEESVGLPQDLLDMADYIVSIPQQGSVRSLNVGVAAGIAMFDYVNKYKGI